MSPSLVVRLTRRGRAVVREDALLSVHAIAVDPAGRRSVLSDGYAVSLPR